MPNAPTVAELEAAPLIEGWEVVPWAFRKSSSQIWGWFFRHPTIDEGHYGHSSLVLQMDDETPPTWARCESRIYRLGHYYRPAEREIRLSAHRLRQQPLAQGEPPGGDRDIETLFPFLRAFGRFREEWLAKLWADHLAERIQ